ncbi:unnamed protein product [Pleuronectes platessa]|uniref:Uncharacterized protein n=1 Tax=Pleuronectes platessa TaxID=8262 RepID=A0A9N7V0N6_PLEPL|nr:unnamed protein product [Pleuronectes platessa]
MKYSMLSPPPSPARVVRVLSLHRVPGAHAAMFWSSPARISRFSSAAHVRRSRGRSVWMVDSCGPRNTQD